MLFLALGTFEVDKDGHKAVAFLHEMGRLYRAHKYDYAPLLKYNTKEEALANKSDIVLDEQTCERRQVLCHRSLDMCERLRGDVQAHLQQARLNVDTLSLVITNIMEHALCYSAGLWICEKMHILLPDRRGLAAVVDLPNLFSVNDRSLKKVTCEH
ncbi:hypothetical protein FNV43_RR14857 [Rhamnella rubrinervis]|uniref:Uncharacterized protein n=1 Tax=Rhamnella rubrinervis TaxID=2594499 RepID=A0A8K0H3W7_9ROSA|nr:hypothetical protein FNV43_RR14857 [Rhamnella rubrinervis]